MPVKLTPLRMLPSTRHQCQKCHRYVRFARTARWPDGLHEIFDPDEVLKNPDAALREEPNGLLIYRTIKDNDPAPRRPGEYAASYHRRTCPGEKGIALPEVDTKVIPLHR